MYVEPCAGKVKSIEYCQSQKCFCADRPFNRILSALKDILRNIAVFDTISFIFSKLLLNLGMPGSLNVAVQAILQTNILPILILREP